MSNPINSEAIVDHLNANENLANDLSEGEKIVVLGIELRYEEDSSLHSSDVLANLTGDNIHITMKGKKEISYDQWVDTHWMGEWEAY